MFDPFINENYFFGDLLIQILHRTLPSICQKFPTRSSTFWASSVWSSEWQKFNNFISEIRRATIFIWRWTWYYESQSLTSVDILIFFTKLLCLNHLWKTLQCFDLIFLTLGYEITSLHLGLCIYLHDFHHHHGGLQHKYCKLSGRPSRGQRGHFHRTNFTTNCFHSQSQTQGFIFYTLRWSISNPGILTK